MTAVLLKDSLAAVDPRAVLGKRKRPPRIGKNILNVRLDHLFLSYEVL